MNMNFIQIKLFTLLLCFKIQHVKIQRTVENAEKSSIEVLDAHTCLTRLISFFFLDRSWRQCCPSPSTQGSSCTLWYMHVPQLCYCASSRPLSPTLCTTGKNSIWSTWTFMLVAATLNWRQPCFSLLLAKVKCFSEFSYCQLLKPTV